MSSSNLVRVTAIEETVYGVTPAAGNFETVRFKSEGLSGTPETTESQQIRTDRMASGQIVVGLTVGGETNHELAKEVVVDDFIESAMFSTFAVSAPISVDMTITIIGQTIDRAAGDFAADGVVVGDLLTLTDFTNAENNTQVMVTEVVSATQIRYAGPDDMITEGPTAGTDFEVNDKIGIGLIKKSFSMEKKFLDLTTKGINYRGMIAAQMSLNFAYGEVATMAFTFAGNDYQAVDTDPELMTDGRTLNAAATSNSLNGSVDMPFLINSSTGTLNETSFCIQSVSLTLNNNLTPQKCIGETAPVDYSEGTAAIEISITAYLADDSWSLLDNKLSQVSFSLGFLTKNTDGYYAYFMPAVQVSFDDPASGGQNQDVLISMTGTAKVGDAGESALTIYKST